PNTSIQKAILLLGAGGNGKSTWLNLVMRFLGKVNTASVSLHRLESDRFAVARLLGRLANICADLPTEHLEGTSTFKALTGGDAIEAEYKFRDSFAFEPFVRLLFSANSPPRSSDSSEGFFDRWLVLPFDTRFRGSSQELTRAELDARLTAPNELSGLLNKAIEAWRRIELHGRLSEPESVQQAWRDFHAMTDPLSTWLDQFTVDDPNAVVTKQVLRAAYGAACEQTGRPAPSDNAFSRALRKARPDVTKGQKTINGRVQWCFLGICLRSEDSQVSQHSQDLPLLVTPTNRTRGNESLEGVNESVKQDRAKPVNAVKPVNGQACPKCGSRVFRDVKLPGGKVRRDCSNGHFVEWAQWPTAG
ncbi:MAG: hypothetical protein IH831_08685, partial [Planctomycetes bacterium]|nr:hypothetical protein [Planctomycetota bacterium]